VKADELEAPQKAIERQNKEADATELARQKESEELSP